MTRFRSRQVRTRSTAVLLGLTAITLLLVRSAGAAESSPSRAIDPEADRILRAMGEYLAPAREFRFAVDMTYDLVRSNGQKILQGGHIDISIRRPDRLHARHEGDKGSLEVVIDGRYYTSLDVDQNLYARVKVPSELGAALDAVFEATGDDLPLADLAFPDPYRVLIDSAESGYLVGRHLVDGTPCHHLAFSNPSIDWQIWIEDGPRPLPRQIAITYKQAPGAPQFIARLSDWELDPRLADGYFEFRPPVGSSEMEFLSIAPKESGQ